MLWTVLCFTGRFITIVERERHVYLLRSPSSESVFAFQKKIKNFHQSKKVFVVVDCFNIIGPGCLELCFEVALGVPVLCLALV